MKTIVDLVSALKTYFLSKIAGKADKVSDATSGNFAALDSNGNLTDSGHKHSDYLTSHQSLAAYYQTGDTAETTLADSDYFPFYDTSASGKKKTLWSDIKSTLKTYFDTLYKGASAHDAWSDVTSKPFNTVGNGLSVSSDALTADVRSVNLARLGTASETVTSYQKLQVNGSAVGAVITGSMYMQSSTKTTTDGVDTFTFTNSNITSNADYDVSTDVFGVAPTEMVQSGTTMQVKFKSSDNVTSCRLYIK